MALNLSRCGSEWILRRAVLFYFLQYFCKAIILVADSCSHTTNTTSTRLRPLKIDKLIPSLQHLLREKTILHSNTTACNGNYGTEIELKIPQFNIFVACCSVFRGIGHPCNFKMCH